MKFFLVAFVASACGGHSSVDAEPANAAVPQKYRAKLHFTSRDVESKLGEPARYEVPVPDGWRMSSSSDTLKPADFSMFGDSAMDVSRHCGNTPCKSRDWDAFIDNNDLAAASFERDERGHGRRFAVGKRDDGKRYVFLAWWTDGADHFDRCEALLDEPLFGAEDAFVKACEAVRLRE